MVVRALRFARRKLRGLHIAFTGQMAAQQWRYWGAKVGRNFRAFGGLHLTVDDGTTIEIGSNVIMRPGVRFLVHHGGSIRIEDNVELKSNVCIEVYGKLILHKGCLLVDGTLIYANGHIEVGEHTMIAGHCVLTDANHGMDICDTPMQYQPLTSPQPITIGEDVWVGAGTKVLPGASIGAHSIIGANSVVNRPVPPYSVAVGSPAKVRYDRREKSGQEPPSQTT